MLLFKPPFLAACLFASARLGVHAAPTSQVVTDATGLDYIHDAQSVMNDVQKRYFDASTGLWDNAWWQSGEVLNMIATMAYRRGNYLTQLNGMNLIDIFNSVLTNAPQTHGSPNFIGDFFDDDLWYANAWIAVYRWAKANSDPDISSQAQTYLNMAQTIVNNAQLYVAPYTNFNGGSKNCYGLQWSKDDPNGGISAIENSLYLKATSQLGYIKLTDTSATWLSSDIDYIAEATAIKQFFYDTGLLNTDTNLVYDGIDMTTCQALTSSAIWTYNTGVLLGALSHYTLATNDGGGASTQADLLASAGMAYFTNATLGQGILYEKVCFDSPTACNGDEQQFKGIFAANILDLFLTTSQIEAYRTWLQANAQSVWTRDRTADNQLGLVWSGPPTQDLTMQEDSSGLEALIGAACVTDV